LLPLPPFRQTRSAGTAPRPASPGRRRSSARMSCSPHLDTRPLRPRGAVGGHQVQQQRVHSVTPSLCGRRLAEAEPSLRRRPPAGARPPPPSPRAPPAPPGGGRGLSFLCFVGVRGPARRPPPAPWGPPTSWRGGQRSHPKSLNPARGKSARPPSRIGAGVSVA